MSAQTKPKQATAALVLENGTVFWGVGFGATGISAPSELCFSTSMTGYQETLTDPSFSEQIINFTFPHIGNVGVNADDQEASKIHAAGMICKECPTEPSNWRSEGNLPKWLKKLGIPGMWGVDTRAVTQYIRKNGPQKAILAYPAKGEICIDDLVKKLKDWDGLEGLDLAAKACSPARKWTKKLWKHTDEPKASKDPIPSEALKVVAFDFGAKDNILRHMADMDIDLHVVPAKTTIEEVLKINPDGVFLSNGPGDPAATAEYAAPMIKGVLEHKIPLFGICLGHQLIAHALGAKTYKLKQGHRGANQPVQEISTGRVFITSQNHGFAVDDKTLPSYARASHVSLFDGSNEGIEIPSMNAFSVQYHPEASPGPHDAGYLFKQFFDLMKRERSYKNQGKVA